jgi:hypothetical protein
MKIIVCLGLLLFAFSYSASAQDLCNPTTFAVKRLKLADTLIGKCDTIYYMGKHTFQVYHNLYEAARNNDVRRLADAYEKGRILYERRIEEQNNEYQLLRNEFSNLYDKSNQFLTSSTAANDSIKVSLGHANESLDRTNQIVNQLRQTLIQDKKNSNRSKIIYGGGGLLVGILTALVIAQ